MKMKNRVFTHGYAWCIVWTLLSFCFMNSCDSGKDLALTPGSGGEPFNPSLPIRVDSIYPTTGAAGQRVLLLGENFGNDPSQLEVYIGGKKAPIVNVQSNKMYCLVPAKAFAGDISVVVNNEGNRYTSEVSDVIFDYQRLLVVSTLLGEVNEQGRFDVKNGPFEDCGGLTNPCFMKWDPENHNLLYVAEDEDADGSGVGVRCIDFEHRQLYTILPKSKYVGSNRGRTIDFYKDDNGVYHLIVAVAQPNINGTAVMMFNRVEDSTYPCGFRWDDGKVIVQNQGCQSAVIHPETHDLYFTNFQNSFLFRVKKKIIEEFASNVRTAPVVPGTDPENSAEMILRVQDIDWEFNITIHPTGKYAYFIVINKNYILRSDFNGERFTAPYVVAGTAAAANAYVDAVGNQARFYRPYQGIFVKNPDYAGNTDEYDFYLADEHNHCIRTMSPLGQVSTYAGRGSASLNSSPWGYVNGDLRAEARFNRIKSIAWDDRDGTFYVGDTNNHRIRKIGLEDMDE